MKALEFWHWRSQNGWVLKDISTRPIKLEHWCFLDQRDMIGEVSYGNRTKKVFTDPAINYLHKMGYELKNLGEYVPTYGSRPDLDPSPHLCAVCGQNETHYKTCYKCRGMY